MRSILVFVLEGLALVLVLILVLVDINVQNEYMFFYPNTGLITVV